MAEASYAKTDVAEIAATVTELRSNFYKTMPTSYEYRLKQLKQLLAMYRENKEEIGEELVSCFGTFARKQILMRLVVVERDMVDAINNLSKWMGTNESVPLYLVHSLNWKVKMQAHPRGVVCIIAPWNFPIGLILRPLVGAIAAGNAVVIKPSEITDNIARLTGKLVNKYLDNNMVRVVYGGVPETTALLKQRFDYIFFTGSPMVGKIVMRAASAHLTPVCLELGGKNPVFVDDSSNLDVSMKRVAYGRWWFNSGQICIAPEYIFVSKSKVQQCVHYLRKHLVEQYVTNDASNTSKKFSDSKHYGRVVNEAHFNRLNEIRQHYTEKEPAKIAIGNPKNSQDLQVFGYELIKDRYMPPMLITIDSSEYNSAKIMEGEVFGPFLTIVGMDGTSDEWKSEAVELTRGKGQPLKCYVYSPNTSFIEYVNTHMSAGTVVANDCNYQAVFNNAPFGGVGESGMGHYGGQYSFEAFSQMRPLVRRDHGMEFVNNIAGRYPPSNYEFLEKIVDVAMIPTVRTYKTELIKYTLGTAALVGAGYCLNKYYIKKDLSEVVEDVVQGVEAVKSTVMSSLGK